MNGQLETRHGAPEPLEPRAPRVVPEVLAGITAPERRAALEAAMAAWWRVTARLAAPAVDAGRLAAALELGGLVGRVRGTHGRADAGGR